MTHEALTSGRTVIHRLDPRARVIAALGFAVIVLVCGRFASLGTALAAAVVIVLIARLPMRPVLRRLVPLNVFMCLLCVLLPIGATGPSLFEIGPVKFAESGLHRAVTIALRANTIVLVATAMISTLDPSALGHALHHLRVPGKLVHLLLMTVRYLRVLHDEYRRLRTAMTVRGFQRRLSWHTCRTLGHLLGMLLVRSMDRAERITAAMKCRGFRGRFYLFDHFTFGGRDMIFAGASMLAGTALLWLELA